MVEQDTVFSSKVKQTGIFSFKDFYSFVYDWLRDEGYDILEKKYGEKVLGEAKQLEIVWEAEKAISDYFKFMIKVDWAIRGMKSVEVQREDKKIKMDSGEVELKIKGILKKDYENRWENNPFWKFLRGVYEKYIIKSRVEDYSIKLVQETNEFIAQCKSFLAISGQHETFETKVPRE